jgi:Bacterial Ig-like domain (group 3)
LVRQVELNGDLHTISGENPGTGSGQGFFDTPTLSGASVVAFGTGALTATFSNSNLTATGQVTLLDITSGSIPGGSATLSANLATFSTSALTPGLHRLVASYGGDALNAPVISRVFVLTITPPAITDFTLIATGETKLFVNPGQTASFTFALHAGWQCDCDGHPDRHRVASRSNRCFYPCDDSLSQRGNALHSRDQDSTAPGEESATFIPCRESAASYYRGDMPAAVIAG